MKESYIALLVIGVFIVGIFLGSVRPVMGDHEDVGLEGMHGMSVSEQRDVFLELRNAMQGSLLHDMNYRCCLQKPCTYCIEKTPGHGEGASCQCLEDILNGVHPCGECIGEILEGHGNPLLAEYFARALAEEVGEEHLDTLRLIIEEKYDFPVDEQF